MKKVYSVLLLLILCNTMVWADIQGDVDGDGKVGLAEAVHALRVTVGMQSAVVVPATKALVSKTGQTKSYDRSGNEINCYNSSGVKIPCTDQAECYDGPNGIVCPGTGQDGYLQKGVEATPPRFTDNGDGTVTDNLTDLIWLKDASSIPPHPIFGDGADRPNALAYCNTLATGIAGLSDNSEAGDWRLPNIKELQSLIDYGHCNPALPEGHPFVGVESIPYWSSTSYNCDTNNVWSISIRYGNIINYGLTDNFQVWPVRDGND